MELSVGGIATEICRGIRGVGIFFGCPKCLPSRKLTYPTLGSSENHRLKSDFLMGYVSSQEGRSFSKANCRLPKLGVCFFWGGKPFPSCSEVSTENHNGNVEIFQPFLLDRSFEDLGTCFDMGLSLGLDEGDWKK